jgi:uncharacterized iron-regulated membrane protein
MPISMPLLRRVHRLATLVAAVLALYLGITGMLIQVIDLRVIMTHAPATDPDLRAIRESFDGPADFQVRQTADYLALPLPASIDPRAMMATTVLAARRALGQVPLTYVELRMAGRTAIGRVGVAGGHLDVNPVSGALLARAGHDAVDTAPPQSLRNDVKHLHRMTTFGDAALVLNILAAIALVVLIATGMLIQWQLVRARWRIGQRALWWRGGGAWRSLHRLISLLAVVVLTVVTLSGAWLAVESAGLALFVAAHAGSPGVAAPPAPLNDAQVMPMLDVTLRALHADAAASPIKVIRLRNYGGYRQGVVVTGGASSQQLVYDAATGRSLAETEPGYPPVPFPFGWQAHQIAKSVHRGDWFGMTGRWLDLAAGLSLIWLSGSGMVLYGQMWRRRATRGQKDVMWR